MTTGQVRVMEKVTSDFRKLKCDDLPEEQENLPMAMKYLTPGLMAEARDKLHETDEVKEKALAEFRLKIEGEKKLFTPTDDLFLLAFLRARKYDVKRAFKLLQNYWKFRKDYNEIFEKTDVDEGCALLERNFIGLLEHRDRDGCTVFVVKAGLWDPDKDPYEVLFRIISAILVYSQEHEATQIAGFRAILDLRGVSWRQMKYCTPPNALLVIRSTQFCYPARYKGIHVLCESGWVKFVWTMVYPLLTTKLKQRLHFHGVDLKPLRQYIHPSVLPEEFGGEAPTFSNGVLLETLRTRSNRVLDQLKYGYQD